MGDPKFSRRKYEAPSHPWRADRIKNEREIQKRFGLKNKREVWKAQSMVRSLRSRSRELQARVRTGERQAEIEVEQLLGRCGRIGLLPMEGTTLNDVLALTIEDVLSRRFQTVVHQKGLAYTPEQARQFIVHGHISINDRIVTIPGYLIKRDEENAITFSGSSPIANDLHPVHPKPKDAIDVEKEEAAAEREKKAEDTKREKRGGKAPKRTKPSEKSVKATTPTLEKLIEKNDGSESNDKTIDIAATDEELKEEAEEKPEAEKETKKGDD